MSSDFGTTYRDIAADKDVPFTMSDGTTLYADIYRPNVQGRFPALLNRVPYNKAAAQAYTYAHPIWYARHGYIVVVQDTRGRWRSEGEFDPFRHEANDGFETVSWVAGLPFCDGRVGLYGYSYCGMNQLLTAARRPPSLRAIAPAFAGSDLYDGWCYQGGAFCLGLNAWWAIFLAQDAARRQGQPELGLRLERAGREMPERYWALPLQDVFPSSELRDKAPYYYAWLDHPARDEFWHEVSVQERYDKIEIPALHIGGWYDSFIEGTLRNYIGLSTQGKNEQVRANQRLVIGPWYHNPWSSFVGAVDFGPEAASLVDEYQLRWFNYWLKGIDTGLSNKPPVKIFVMGENIWRDEQGWPLVRAREIDYFLHSNGRANSINGDGWLSPSPPSEELPDVYVYDPSDPVPSAGGRSCCVPLISPMGPIDQRLVETRNDVLVYSTQPLERDIEVTGPVTAVLWASSSAEDTDFTVKLVDVYPDGRAINLCDGIVRARFRESLLTPSLIVPNEVYRYEIRVGATSNLFRKGHRIRVEVSSSNFPTYDRNPNTGQWPKDARQCDMQIATQVVYHERKWPSHIRLPIIPR
jgi:putative CocE/NonD family hydrolase